MQDGGKILLRRNICNCPPRLEMGVIKGKTLKMEKPGDNGGANSLMSCEGHRRTLFPLLRNILAAYTTLVLKCTHF